MEDTVDAPSGVALPFLLREKWKTQAKEDNGETFVSVSSHVASVETSSGIMDTAPSVSVQALSSRELESRISSIGKFAIADLHKQIQRGEEAYYDDTYGHGNLFRGWESFVDSKDIGGGGAPSQQLGSRRIPADCRWFSGSFSNLSRTGRNISIAERGNPRNLLSTANSPTNAELPLGVTGSSVALSSTQKKKRMSLTNASATAVSTSPLFVGCSKDSTSVQKPRRDFPNLLAAEKHNPDHPDIPEEKTQVLPVKRKLRTDPFPGLSDAPPSVKKKAEDEKNLQSSKDVPSRLQNAEDESSTVEKKKPSMKTIDSDRHLKGGEERSQEGKQSRFADSGLKEERSKREEPSKRRSSRNRKAT